MKTRRLRLKSRKVKKSRKASKMMKGGGEWCYGKGKTWSCSTACGENGACQAYD